MQCSTVQQGPGRANVEDVLLNSTNRGFSSPQGCGQVLLQDALLMRDSTYIYQGLAVPESLYIGKGAAENMAWPGRILRNLSFVIFTSQVLFFAQVQAQNYFEAYPLCAQQYLNGAFPDECNTGYITTIDDCLCSNTGYFISNSMLSVGVNCGCDIVWASAYLMFTICEEYAGGSTMDEGQMIAAGNGGTSTCSTTTATPTLPSTLQPAVPTTTSYSPTTIKASSASSTATPASNPAQASHGIDADGKLSLAVGLPGALFAIIQIIGWIMSGKFLWMYHKCCHGGPRYKTLYQQPPSYPMSSG